MQRGDDAEKLSRFRAALSDALKELTDAVRVGLDRSVLVKGNVYELARKCGKPSCACADGKPHRSMVLSWSHQGKTRLMTVPPEKLDRLRSGSARYLRHRAARARVTAMGRRIVLLFDQIEKLRREKP